MSHFCWVISKWNDTFGKQSMEVGEGEVLPRRDVVSTIRGSGWARPALSQYHENMIRLVLAALLCFCGSCFAADPTLHDLRLTLESMRGKQLVGSRPRGAVPQLTTAKHQLRDWVDIRLKTFARDGDVGALERSLNSDLRTEKLFDAGQPDSDTWELRMGFLGELTIRRQGIFLVLQTAFTIQCGYDESAYVYSWTDEGWRRIWQNEQDTYTEKDYKPQTLVAVSISPYSQANDYVVLTLGRESWCASNWHEVYYRAFRLGADQQARPLVDGSAFAFVVDDPPIEGVVTNQEILVEFTVGSLDGGVHSREAIEHYRFDEHGAKRIDPLALGPRDFVEEWLSTTWTDAAHWSESAGRALMRDRHEAWKMTGEFIFPTMHCPRTPDLWQVGIRAYESATKGQPPPSAYFLVRWRPPYRFSMVRVSDHPFPGCTEEDRETDEEHPTLFPHRR
jgi:hypothetical protein